MVRTTLFYYLVHEKTILFPLLPILLLSYDDADQAIWFTLSASFSMIPLYIKDHNLFMALCVILCFLIVFPLQKPVNFFSWEKGNQMITLGGFGGMLSLLLFYCFPAPSRYPDLHSVLISAYSCVLFSFHDYLLLRKLYWECQ